MSITKTKVAIFLLLLVATGFGLYAWLHNPTKQAVKQPPPAPTQATTEPQTTVDGLLSLTNGERAKVGDSQLVLDDNLNQSAAAKCRDMITRNYGQHIDPSGQPPSIFVKKYYPSYVTFGENLAYGFYSNQAIITAWLNSPEHRDNMLRKNYERVGFGICQSDNFLGRGHTTIVVEHLIDLP